MPLRAATRSSRSGLGAIGGTATIASRYEICRFYKENRCRLARAIAGAPCRGVGAYCLAPFESLLSDPVGPGRSFFSQPLQRDMDKKAPGGKPPGPEELETTR